MPPAAWIAATFEITERTARRWTSGDAPPWFEKVASLLFFGDLGAVFEDWHGWTIERDYLQRDRMTLTRNQLDTYEYYQALLKTIQQDQRREARHPAGLNSAQRAVVCAALNELEATQQRCLQLSQLLEPLALVPPVDTATTRTVPHLHNRR